MGWSGRALPRQRFKLARGTKDKEHAMSEKLNTAIAVIGIDIGKNSFHVVGHDERGAIVLHQKWSRGQVAARFANMPPCLIGMEACVGAHHLSRKLKALGHDARLMPAKYVRPYSKGQKNDFGDAEAIAEAVQRPSAARSALSFIPWCLSRGCNHFRILDVSAYPDDVPVPSFGPRLRCERCGHLGADARPNWQERAAVGAFAGR
jgi:hypothetical protein